MFAVLHLSELRENPDKMPEVGVPENIRKIEIWMDLDTSGRKILGIATRDVLALPTLSEQHVLDFLCFPSLAFFLHMLAFAVQEQTDFDEQRPIHYCYCRDEWTFTSGDVYYQFFGCLAFRIRIR